MEIREALKELGAERVRIAMLAFDDPRNAPDELDTEAWEVCFLARAYGAPGRLLRAMLALEPRIGVVGGDQACALLDISEDAMETLTHANDESPCVLRSEATVWLAEHGSSPEPSPLQTQEVG